MARKIGNLWLRRDSKGRTFLVGWISLPPPPKRVQRGYRITLPVKVKPNSKTSPEQPDYIVRDYTQEVKYVREIKGSVPHSDTDSNPE